MRPYTKRMQLTAKPLTNRIFTRFIRDVVTDLEKVSEAAADAEPASISAKSPMVGP